jgi:hypothetical protein
MYSIADAPDESKYQTDISQYPSPDSRFSIVPDPHMQVSCTLGDAHGNVLRIIHFCIAHNLIELDEQSYKSLYGIVMMFWGDESNDNGNCDTGFYSESNRHDIEAKLS